MKLLRECFLCRQQFPFGPQVYDLKSIPVWEIMACKGCRDKYHDGIIGERHRDLVDHLKANKIPIGLNAKGLIDWPREPGKSD